LLGDLQEVKYWLFDTTPPDSPISDDEGDEGQAQIICISQLEVYEASQPFIVPHATWKLYGNPMAKDGEYRYVHSGVREHVQWPSIRHYIADQVVQFEVDIAVLRALNALPQEEDLDTAEDGSILVRESDALGIQSSD